MTNLVNFLKIGLILTGLLVFISWPLDGAIALRNISLVTGSIFALATITLQIESKRVTWLTPLNPATCSLLLLLLGWILLRFLALSEFPELEKKEIFSVWMRSLLATLVGTAIGLAIIEDAKYKTITLITIGITILAEYYLGLLSNIELSRTPYDGFFKSKAAASYLLLVPYLIACGYIYFVLSLSKNFTSKTSLQLGLSIITIGLSLFAFYFSKSLNGFLVAGVCATPLLLRILTDVLKQKKMRGLKVTIVAIFISSFIGFLGLHSKHDSKLNNIISDAYLGTQIDLYSNWQNNLATSWVPIPPDGHAVNQSTYYRTAHMLNGIRLIKEHPLGLGFTNLPYGYLMKQKYPLSQATHTHSGWIDFALGQGIPGLLLLWLSILSAFILGLRSVRKSDSHNFEERLWGYVTMWVMGGIFIAWIFNEVSEREYIEQLFFIISLFAAGNTFYKPLVIKTS